MRRKTRKAEGAKAARLTGEYRRSPWGYLGMVVRIYRATKDALRGPQGGLSLPKAGSLYAMRSARGVIATADTMDALSDLARANRWVATYRHVDADGREVWVSIPD